MSKKKKKALLTNFGIHILVSALCADKIFSAWEHHQSMQLETVVTSVQ